MSTLNTIGTTVRIIVTALIALTILISLTTLLGGLVGAIITIAYNILFGASFDVLSFALIGSIIMTLAGVTTFEPETSE